LCDGSVKYELGAPEGRQALQGVSLAVRRGDRVGLMGPAGSGKTTLLHVLSRLLPLSQGSLQTQEKQLPSLVFQFPERQLFAETVRDDVAYGLRESGVPPADVEERVLEALEDVGLPAETFGARSPFRLSAGEKRRVALAGALAQRRALVFLDEPTLGLDAEGIARLVAILERMHDRGVATWVASHDADFIAATCSHLVVMDRGRVAFQGTVEEFWSDAVRSESCGVRLPKEAALAHFLRACGIQALPARPTLEQIVSVLLDLWHKPEQISYLGLTPGVYTMDDGSVWEVGSFENWGNGVWKTVSFQNAFASTPALFLTIQTANGTETTTARARNVAPEGFDAAMDFGEPTVTTRCPVTSGVEDVCNFVAYSGEDDADGVSYGDNNIDVYKNVIYRTSDDLVEPDYGFHNYRIWGNRLWCSLAGISFQPCSICSRWRRARRSSRGSAN